MPNFAALLKEEIRRLARREIRARTRVIKAATAQHRRDIASLKRELIAIKKGLAFLETQERARMANPQVAPEVAQKARFSAKWLLAHRRRLKLAACDYAKLVGVSTQTIYHWEQGRSKPRKAQLAALVAARQLGRREALRRLAMLEGAGRRPA